MHLYFPDECMPLTLYIKLGPRVVPLDSRWFTPRNHMVYACTNTTEKQITIMFDPSEAEQSLVLIPQQASADYEKAEGQPRYRSSIRNQ